MNPRYIYAFEDIAITGAQDIFEVLAGDFALKLCEVIITQSAQETSEKLDMVIHLITTAGSGGTALTPRKVNPFSPNCTATVTRNNTTQGTDGALVHPESPDIKDGFFFLPVERDMPIFKPAERFAVALEAAPAASINVHGKLILEELSGDSIGLPRASSY